MNQIENQLRQIIGLDSATIGSTLIERAVRARMRACELTKKDDYLKLVQASPAEWDSLVESVVITETWFFRDRNSFQALVRLVFDEWLPAHPAAKLRLLSFPCSSGEEPYSMAMALMDAGLSAKQFQIDAVDISARALACAERAVYGKNSFRGPDLDFRTRYFQPTTEGHVLGASVRRHVSFQQGNLLDDKCLMSAEDYDFIFCRNLLIYFDAATQTKALSKLHHLLAPSGTLFLGPAELPLAMDNGFVSAHLPLSFACRSADSAAKASEQRPRSTQSVTNQNSAQPQLPPSAPSMATRKLPHNLMCSSAADHPFTELDRARQLADEGRLDEAAEICETHLREHGVSAQAYYLLGLVRNAAGADSQAGEFYRKALYLEPNHYETLMQWASLAKKIGDGNHARILQERAERVKKRT
jgi:chemotaxis protein methyltransferase WspC